MCRQVCQGLAKVVGSTADLGCHLWISGGTNGAVNFHQMVSQRSQGHIWRKTVLESQLGVLWRVIYRRIAGSRRARLIFAQLTVTLEGALVLFHSTSRLSRDSVLPKESVADSKKWFHICSCYCLMDCDPILSSQVTNSKVCCFGSVPNWFRLFHHGCPRHQRLPTFVKTSTPEPEGLARSHETSTPWSLTSTTWIICEL